MLGPGTLSGLFYEGYVWIMNHTFKTQLTVRVTDINYGGHLGNDSFYSFFHEVRIRYFRELGLSEGDIGEGVSLTQSEGHIEYKAEAFLGDVLLATVFIDQITRTRFRINYEFFRQSDGKLIGTGYAVLAAFDYNVRKPQKLPDSFVEKINAYQKQ